jgi:hypothetical protein
MSILNITSDFPQVSPPPPKMFSFEVEQPSSPAVFLLRASCPPVFPMLFLPSMTSFLTCCSHLDRSLSFRYFPPLSCLELWDFRFSQQEVRRWQPSGIYCCVNEGCTHLWNVGLLQWDYMVRYPRRLSSSSTLEFSILFILKMYPYHLILLCVSLPQVCNLLNLSYEFSKHVSKFPSLSFLCYMKISLKLGDKD